MSKVEIASRRRCDRCRMWIGVYHVDGGDALSCGPCLTPSETASIDAERAAVANDTPAAVCSAPLGDGTVCQHPAWRMESYSGHMRCGAHYRDYNLEDLRAAVLG